MRRERRSRRCARKAGACWWRAAVPGLPRLTRAMTAWSSARSTSRGCFPGSPRSSIMAAAGTTLAAARAGTPQLIVPQVADQPYWAGRIAELGIGAAHDGAVPAFETLSAGLGIALAPKTRERAATIARTIRANGASIAADVIVARFAEESAGT